MHKGGFPLSRNFFLHTEVKFTRVIKIEAMHKRSRVAFKLNLATHILSDIDPILSTHVNRIEAMYERSRVNVIVEPGSTFPSTRDLPYNASILFYLRIYKNYATVEIQL